MPRALDPTIAKVLKEYDEDAKSATWDCHGVTVVLHKAIERMAARARIVFDAPVIVEANTPGKTATIIVTGKMGDRTEWSFGEASPANNKNAYPFAMAEKRAKDRVVLKLLGLHGLAYSEDESDDFKEPAAPRSPSTGSRGAGAVSPPAPAPANHEDPADTYVATAMKAMRLAQSPEDLKAWWAGEAVAREDFGITKGTKRYAALWDAFLAKGTELKNRPDPDAWQSEEEAA